MKIVHPILEQLIVFEENKVNILVIENKKMFSKILWELKDQHQSGDGRFVLSTKTKELDLNKTAVLIYDPFDLDVSQRKIVNRLYKELEEISENKDYFLDTKLIISTIISYLESIVSESEYPISIEHYIEVTSLYKLANLKVELSGDTMLEQLVDYIKIVHQLLKVPIFIMVNLHSFLDFDEIEQLYNTIMYDKINLLLIESSVPGKKHPCDKMVIVDNDLCIIHVD